MQRLLPRHIIRASFPRAYRSYSFATGPSPPKLPADQQAEFERLQRNASLSPAFQPPPLSSDSSKEATATKAASAPSEETALPTGVRRGAPPEFTGDTNPRTGEVGGPKNEPLRWGGEADWSYNGRVTDF
ncbi:hypothetical protein E4U13_001241 [Claviceps humidiphila]|uniref:Succinate dehydrogenase assembly factor 4, mitochondrial n=1 Tax=Claviceps humidiphila TaxID=1294629 RepID=A0A9P7TRD5_9HYPO|nr:hypothetical protein E4U52_000685 [Claviceps spartinae]KAG6053285.1 hypothetical protein E4U32_007726 [Claviceps aff. humidiphila group G2b]KAG6109983.1 hypothetical protein E4U14_003012 [Claviceps sp. LM454 group G7]KAG6117246.1 hypothetical protein E4U13_001241 [Claviceps humidiphila]